MRLMFNRLLLFLPIPIFMCMVSYHMDPANMFVTEKYESGIADILLSGMNVANITDCDDRLIQKCYINGLSKKKDIIVLGSSTSLSIGTEFFPGKSLFNNSVAAGSIEDSMAIYWMYRKREMKPSAVIISLDSWLLNRNNGLMRYPSIKKEQEEVKAFLGITTEQKEYFRLFGFIPDKYFELISPDYFQASFTLLVRRWKNKGGRRKTYYATRSVLEEEPVKVFDGTFTPTRKSVEESPEYNRREAAKFANDMSLSALSNYRKLDEETSKKLDKFTDLLLKDGVKVVFYLPAYHPEVCRILKGSKELEMMGKAREHFKSMAKEKGIKVYGAYDPAESDLVEADFYDGLHAKPEAVKKIFNGRL